MGVVRYGSIQKSDRNKKDIVPDNDIIYGVSNSASFPGLVKKEISMDILSGN